MPEGQHPGTLLRGGEFYSTLEARLRTEDVLLSELRQPCSRNVPRHQHELAYVTVVLRGDYLEGDHGTLEELQPFNAVFNPSGVQHATVIGPAGASFFTIELHDQHLRQLGVRLPRQTAFDRGAGAMLWPGLRLYSAFKRQTADPLVLESHVLELLGAIEGSASVERSAPRWLDRVKERMHEEFRDNLRMRNLAEDAGVHPVHLARVFRALEGHTPGDYVQRLRVRAACHLLHDHDYSLAVIAAECGFSDQSHFTRVFRKFTETTPAQFRRALAPRAVAD
ncbi:MAG TPA: AraC family transcriptional regulator [Candidatus Acidoferrum sp.]|nr:AraC family transcriptional regulator [Candidatus Acidoferrum sp.]